MKNELLENLFQLNNWVVQVKDLEREKLYQPIDTGKWSIAEIISHLMNWDRYILEGRLPLMIPNAKLKSNVDVTEMNNTASEYALSEVSIAEIIDSLIDYRNRIISHLRDKSEEELNATFMINKTELSLVTYFKGTVQHDAHHIQQIENFLKL